MTGFTSLPATAACPVWPFLLRSAGLVLECQTVYAIHRDRTAPVTLLSLLSLAGYSLSAFLIYRNLSNWRPSQRWIALSPALFAVLIEALQLRQAIYLPDGRLDLDFFNAFALISWLVSIQIMIASLHRPLHSLGIPMFPVAGLAALAAAVMPTGHGYVLTPSAAIQGHIMLSIIAYSLIMLSALHAVVLAWQDHAIRSHHPGGLVRFLPPLHDMETLLFQMLGFGFIFLTSSLITGFLFFEDLFAQHLAHKTLLSLIGWVILAVLLFGRFRFGWRGKKAIRLTLSAFVFIMLAYFGSKLVLEFLV